MFPFIDEITFVVHENIGKLGHPYLLSKGDFFLSVKWRQGAPARVAPARLSPFSPLGRVITPSTGQVQPCLGSAGASIGQSFGEAEADFRLSTLRSRRRSRQHLRIGLCANAFHRRNKSGRPRGWAPPSSGIRCGGGNRNKPIYRRQTPGQSHAQTNTRSERPDWQDR